jgi:hypothetical protein
MVVILVPLWRWEALSDLELAVDLFLNGRIDQTELAVAHKNANVKSQESTDGQEQEDPDYYTDDRDEEYYENYRDGELDITRYEGDKYDKLHGG